MVGRFAASPRQARPPRQTRVPNVVVVGWDLEQNLPLAFIWRGDRVICESTRPFLSRLAMLLAW